MGVHNPSGERKVARQIVRTLSAGVFFAEVESRKGDEVVLTNARRLWYWSGAASLSEMAVKGVSNPNACKFPAPVPRETVLGVIEILDVTEQAAATLDSVPIWTVHPEE